MALLIVVLISRVFFFESRTELKLHLYKIDALVILINKESTWIFESSDSTKRNRVQKYKVLSCQVTFTPPKISGC